MPVLPDSSRVTQYVQALGHKLAAQAPGYSWPYNFHVVNVADINAFALPGGYIFVNLGTIQAASNEAQLAAVMSHEISHVVLQHSICNLEKEKRLGLFAGLGQIASGILLGDSTLGALAQKGIGLTAGLGFLRMASGCGSSRPISKAWAFSTTSATIPAPCRSSSKPSRQSMVPAGRAVPQRSPQPRQPHRVRGHRNRQLRRQAELTPRLHRSSRRSTSRWRP